MEGLDHYQDKIDQVKTMQLATARQLHPWICSVYFVLQDGRFYWLSEPQRRHSRELANNPQIAIALVIKPDIPVIGMQLEGKAMVVNDASVVKRVMDDYVNKYGVGQTYHERFEAGIHKHQLYCFTPESVSVFDEMKENKYNNHNNNGRVI